MLGSYDFCGHYAWTFSWIRRNLGEEGLKDYWLEAVSKDAQRHARTAFMRGFPGMEEYWGHSLASEGAGYTARRTRVGAEEVMRIDMHACPSKGFLLRNGLDYAIDYCSHCVAWIEPALEDAGYCVDHEHDHYGRCWWEIRTAGSEQAVSTPGAISGDDDVRLARSWSDATVHRFERSELRGMNGEGGLS